MIKLLFALFLFVSCSTRGDVDLKPVDGPKYESVGSVR